MESPTLAILNQLDSALIHLLEIIGSIEETVVPAEAQPLDVFLDGFHIFHIFLGGVRVVHTQIADAAKLFGREDDARWSYEKAAEVRDSFLKEYSNGNGSFAKDEKSALASAIGFGLCPENEIRQTVEKLNTAMISDGCRADFGIVGAKFVPRVLAEHGYADTALQIFRQENYPGWAKWVLDGETTLIEDFPGKESHNHIMYGDISAWFMQYAAGIEPSFDRPGFREVVLKPCFVSAFDHVDAWYDTIYGRINVRWKRTAAGIAFTADIPAGIPGKLILPDGRMIPFENTIDQVFSSTR